MNTESPSSYIGLMQLGSIMCKQAEERSQYHMLFENDQEAAYHIVQTLMNAIQIHGMFAESLAVFYELHGFPDQCIERMYQYAIAHDDHEIPLCNYADYLKKCGRDRDMVFWLQTAVDQYKSSYAGFMLALHHAKHRMNEEATHYYRQAIAHHGDNPTFTIDTFVETAETIQLVHLVREGNLPTDNPIYRELSHKYQSNKIVAIYNNKVRLFQSLNHVTECGICYNNALHIDFECGHCVCSDCYLNMYQRPCPFCRNVPIS